MKTTTSIAQKIREFAKGRTHLPWRPPSLKLRKGKADPYPVLVAEVMLQQTQVDRVVPFYNAFIKKFPTPQKLARVPLSKVLKEWNGLGYNRRANYLHQAVKHITQGGWPKDLEDLPGVGRYTARAVAAFAFNKPEVFVETNIRTVFLHHYFRGKKKVSDAELLPLVEQTLKQSKMPPRQFYAAVMDYGAHLKKSGINVNAKSKHYAKQSKFAGSARELRGAILRELLKHRASLSILCHRIPRNKEEIAREAARLAAEGLVKVHGRYFSLPS